MVGSRSPLTTDLTKVPLPRRPLDPSGPDDPVRRWYENELDWPTVPASTPRSPVRLRVGPRFDVLDVPAEAGRAALRHLAEGSPVAVRGDRVRLLMAAGSTEELPGILEWLEWGALPLDLRALGPGDSMEAPLPPGAAGSGFAEIEMSRMPDGTARSARGEASDAGAALGGGGGPAGQSSTPGVGAGAGRLIASGPDGLTAVALPGPGRGVGARPLALGRPDALQGAALWLRPPEPGCEVEASLPTVSALGGGGGAPDLVRVVNTVAWCCHRLRLRRARP
ncbi:SCO3374 family protein [Streptomyces sp. SID13726]|uniref:SCO3374 family protein n=1 Tax=Streptomyces sp. SID13726 TaxID=2706058 RepID=UPI0013B88377|nr:SCO3374 family protein [Streptomyces sp. SID13726]NEB00743.1 hypothetical protein [Streptomyces sp. SID13726]